MSKVVTYLPPDVPRILINRNIVRVPTTANEDVLFHACLLGNCGKVLLVVRFVQAVWFMHGQLILTSYNHLLPCI